MKKKLILLLILLVVIVGIGFKFYVYAQNIIKQPFVNEKENIEITIKNGDTLNNIIDSLYEDNKIGNSYVVKWYIKKYKLNTNIKPGNYSFSKDISLDSFVRDLNQGKYNENSVRVTIPEGYDINKIASLFEDKQIISKEDFINAVKDYSLPSYIKKDTNRKYALEGYLFPDTYEVIKGMEGKDIIKKMLVNFENVLEDIKKKNNLNLSKEQIDEKIILASMIEREAEAADERPIVASVLYNRLNINMKLQIDATVEYALGNHKAIYTYEDIKVQSPYNTYWVSGLPIGPICNPGQASILAALEPASTKYIYYVSKFDGSKTHFFSDNYQKFLNDKKISEANYKKMNK